jgi:O-antigen/teichoic acid export membrane protein
MSLASFEETPSPPSEGTQCSTVRVDLIRKRVSLFFKPTARAGWAALVNQGVVSLNNFFTGVIIGRYCSKGEFGLYMLGLSIVLIMIDLQASLISTPYMIYSPRFKGRQHRLYAGSSLLHELLLATLVIIALVVWGVVLSMGFGTPGLGRVIWALAAVIGFIMFREFIRRVCFADLRMEVAVFFDLCVAVAQIGGLILLYHFGILSADHAFWVIGASCGIAGAGWIILNKKSFIPQVGKAISDLHHNWKFGKWVFASAVVWTISMNLYPWILTFFHGTASTGVWAACLGVIALINVPLMGVQNFLGPKIANVYAESGRDELRRFAFKASLYLIICMSILCCALFAVADPLLSFLYGAKYTGNGLVVFALALGLVAAGAAFSFSRALFTMERADVDFKVNFVSLFVLFAFGTWLVRSFGPLGAALGLLLANVTSSGVRCASFAILSHPSAAGKPS